MGSVAALLVFASAAAAAPVFSTVTNYRSAADIPAGFYAGGSPTALEDFEDSSLDFGITASGGFFVGPSTFTDSVDADDGTIDGFGRLGHSYGVLGAGTATLTFTFASPATAAALVITDAPTPSSTQVYVEAFGPGMVSLGTAGPFTLDTSSSGQTPEDRFVGVQEAGGIFALRVTSNNTNTTNTGIELDHVQFGSAPLAVPQPATLLLLASGLGGLVLRSRPRRDSGRVAMRRRRIS
jgi:hypothetical protein